MKFFIKGILFFALIIGVLLGSFALYAHFLMDYSLESLTFVASAAKENSYSDEKLSNASQSAYLGIVQGMAVEEASEDNLDLQNLALLDLASRSLDEAQYRTGYMRANHYLNAVMENKQPKRSIVLRFTDNLTRSFFGFLKSVQDFLNYLFRPKDGQRNIDGKVDLENYASSLLLNQAQEAEWNGLLYQAEEKYRKFVSLYKNNANRPMVVISLANILIREKKFKDASKFLSQIQAEFSGREEGEMISKLARRVEAIEAKLKLIADLKGKMGKERDVIKRQTLFLKLGAAYVGTYQFDKAENVFLKLENSDDSKIRKKAGFYLGWIYKNSGEYDKSIQVFMRLSGEADNDEDFMAALKAQLADTYYKKGDTKRSAELYKSIAAMQSGNRNALRDQLRGRSWASASESELVNIYTFDLKNAREAREHMNKLMNLEGFSNSAQSLSLTLEWSGKISLRDLGFQALSEKQLTKALELFTKYLSQYSGDSLTLSGLATVYALMGDFESAYTYAQKGYESQASEYSLLTLGYIQTLRENYQDAIEKNRQVLVIKPDSLPARFNLAYSYLKLEQYQPSLDIMLPLEKAMRGNLSDKVFLSKTLNNIGYCYWGSGDAVKSAEYFKKAIEANPHFLLARKNLEEIKRLAVPKAVRLMD